MPRPRFRDFYPMCPAWLSPPTVAAPGHVSAVVMALKTEPSGDPLDRAAVRYFAYRIHLN